MLSKWQKIRMYSIGLLSLLLALAVIIPYRAFWPQANLFTLEFIIKLLIIPVIVILISVEPTIFKYRQIARYREQSKIISVMSYFPIVCYLLGLLVHSVYTLMKGAGPFLDHGLGMGAHSLWLVIMIATIVFLLVAFPFFHHFEMQLDTKEHIIFDVCFFVIVVFFIVLSHRINIVYRDYFALYVPRTGSMGEIELFFIFLLFVLFFGISLSKIGNLVRENEILISLNPKDYDVNKERVRMAEFNRAYNEILTRFEQQFMSMGEEEELTEEMVPETETKAAQEVDLKKEECEEELILPKAEPIAEPQEITAEEPIPEVGVSTEPEPVFEVEPVKEKPVVAQPVIVEGEPEIIEEIVEVQAPVDPQKRKEVEEERLKLEQAKALLAEQEALLEEKQKVLEEKKKELPVEKPKPERPKEPKPPVEKEPLKIQPSFRVVTNYAKSIPGITVIESEDKKRMRFMVGKKLFLIANETDNDYRFTFLYDLDKIVDLMIKYPIVVKAKTPKGENWFKLVNKGEFLEEDLYSIIDNAYATIQILEDKKREEKLASRAQAKAKE
ncbi:MAG: hypothetical protein PHG08_09000 [Bacilli bacterium]|jgi:predicted DNA-binding protein (MmcQ/YjbR family)|nr:hypothetical protein [Bacilli bacterium]HHU23499.1 hypothetical protein [Acholeplasmataceae bacterium]